MLRAYAQAYGMGFVSLRYFNVAAAHPDGETGEDHRPETHLIPLVLQVPLGKHDSILIFGDDYDTPDGTCIRDYIHVCDLADAHVLAAAAIEQGKVKVYNLGRLSRRARPSPATIYQPRPRHASRAIRQGWTPPASVRWKSLAGGRKCQSSRPSSSTPGAGTKDTRTGIRNRSPR